MNQLPKSSLSAAVAVAAALLALSGCTSSTTTGSDQSSSATESTSASASEASPSGSASESGSSSASTAPSASATGKPVEVAKGITVTGGKGETPVVTITDESKPVATLHKVDLYQGKGDPVVDGSNVTVNYVGLGQASKQVFDSSFERGEPITFPLGSVIEGWQEGLIGMQPGGRRVLVIPGDMAYGSAGNPPAIGQDETLVFVVDLEETTPGQ